MESDIFKSGYLRNFERAVFQEAKPGRARRIELWQQVIYHNLVLRMLPSRRSRDRPKEPDYRLGWQRFIQIAKLTGVERGIVYGTDGNKLAALRDRYDR